MNDIRFTGNMNKIIKKTRKKCCPADEIIVIKFL